MKMTIGTAPTAMLHRTQIKERKLSNAKKVPSRSVGKARAHGRRTLETCDNSNDSGLGFDHHVDTSAHDRVSWLEEPAYKRSRLEIKLENDEVNENFEFPEIIRCKENTSLIRTAPVGTTTAFSISSNQTPSTGRTVPRCVPITHRNLPTSPLTLTTQLNSTSRISEVSLAIISQPEQQHRARYQTEGSRGAVKDRSGESYPIVRLNGYDKPATLQVFIGTDCGKVSPHMFYQACRVSGKNSTPCTETKIEGTIVIELQIEPKKDVTCDCVGILKERNVDVEHRFPDQHGSRNKKKSTRCRMVFRTTITHDDGNQETLQVCSQPIVCTQPPGIPEICKKSLTSCVATGGLELFVLGKNFLKDTMVYFQQIDESNNTVWEKSVSPDKEFLQQTHLVCVVPPYSRPNITEPVTVKLYVASSGKTSEPQEFVYTPISGVVSSVSTEARTPVQFLNKLVWQSGSKQDEDSGMMPPPETSMVPLLQRRLSANHSQNSSEPHSPPLHLLKQEIIDENSQNSLMESTSRFRYVSESSLDVHNADSNLSVITENSVDIRRNSITSEIDQNTMPEAFNEASLHSDCSNMSITNTNTQSQVIMPQIKLFHNEIIQTTVQPPTQSVVDLTLRPPLGTVADLVSTNAPSLATLETFGITEGTNPLPAQSSQSVETYLNKIEVKPDNVDVKFPPTTLIPQIYPVTTVSGSILPMTSTDIKNNMMIVNDKQNILNNMLVNTEKAGIINDIILAEKRDLINNMLVQNEKREIINNMLVENEKREIINNILVENEKREIINNILVENEKREMINMLATNTKPEIMMMGKQEIINNMIVENEKREIINNILVENEKRELINNILTTNTSPEMIMMVNDKREIINNMIVENEKCEIINNILVENKKQEMINNILVANEKVEIMNNILTNEKTEIDKRDIINNIIVENEKREMINNIIVANEKAEIINNIITTEKPDIVNNMLIANEKREMMNNIIEANEKANIINNILTNEKTDMMIVANDKANIISNILASNEKTEMMTNILVANEKANMVLTNEKTEMINNMIVANAKSELLNNIIASEAKQSIAPTIYIAQKTINAEMPTVNIESPHIQSVPSQIPTDALVNCAAANHIQTPFPTTQNEVHVTTQDLLLNHRNSIMVPSIIPNMMPNTEVSSNSNALSSSVILNSQISPSLMCPNDSYLSTTTALSICTNNAPLHTISPNPPSDKLFISPNLITSHPQISEQHLMPKEEQTLHTSQGFIPTAPACIMNINEVKPEKKPEEIPAVFTIMTDNELMNIINPNCFDQV